VFRHSLLIFDDDLVLVDELIFYVQHASLMALVPRKAPHEESTPRRYNIPRSGSSAAPYTESRRPKNDL
jgi:hypothetical protein